MLLCCSLFLFAHIKIHFFFVVLFFFFFFKQKTAYEMRISDWSSDVCSSDLPQLFGEIDEKDRILYLYADQRDQADHRREAQRIARQPQRQDGAEQAERYDAGHHRDEPEAPEFHDHHGQYAEAGDDRRRRHPRIAAFLLLRFAPKRDGVARSEEQTSELHSLMRI